MGQDPNAYLDMNDIEVALPQNITESISTLKFAPLNATY